MERVPLKGNDNLVRGCLSITATGKASAKKQPLQRLPFNNKGQGDGQTNNLVRGCLSITATGKASAKKQPRQRLPFNNSNGKSVGEKTTSS